MYKRQGDDRGGKAFFDFTPRIIYLNSRTREDSGMMEFYEGKLNHLWVDICILDRLPESRAGAEFAKFLQKAVYGMAMGPVSYTHLDVYKRQEHA